MEDYPKTVYSIIVESCVYSVHEQEQNRFFVTHVTPYSHVISFVETAIFILSPEKGWRVEGNTNINKEHWLQIFQAIESGIV